MKLHEPFVSIYHEGSDKLKFQVLFPINKNKPVYAKRVAEKELKLLKERGFLSDKILETDIIVAYTFDKSILDSLQLNWKSLEMKHIGLSWLSRIRFAEVTGDLKHHDKDNHHPSNRLYVKELKPEKKHDGTIHWPEDD